MEMCFPTVAGLIRNRSIRKICPRDSRARRPACVPGHRGRGGDSPSLGELSRAPEVRGSPGGAAPSAPSLFYCGGEAAAGAGRCLRLAAPSGAGELGKQREQRMEPSPAPGRARPAEGEREARGEGAVAARAARTRHRSPVPRGSGIPSPKGCDLSSCQGRARPVMGGPEPAPGSG